MKRARGFESLDLLRIVVDFAQADLADANLYYLSRRLRDFLAGARDLPAKPAFTLDELALAHDAVLALLRGLVERRVMPVFNGG